MDTEKKAVSEREFLETWGLFREFRLTRDWKIPEKISRDCAVCKKEERTWQLRKHETSLGLDVLRYACTDCEQDRVVFVLRNEREYEKAAQSGRGLPPPPISVRAGPAPRLVSCSTWLVGQFPFPTARISKALEARLGDDAVLYKKGINCLNEGFGIGAVSYVRRVVENKTNELIDVVADFAVAEGFPADQVEGLRAARDSKASYDEKLEVAAPLIPKSLRPGEANPLSELHHLLSVGLHGKTEGECLQIAADLREIFEYVFERLRAQIDDARSFRDKLTTVAGKRSR